MEQVSIVSQISQRKLIASAFILSVAVAASFVATPVQTIQQVRVAPTSFGVQDMQLANGTGTAKINLDHFILNVDFDYSGAQIDALQITRITDLNGDVVPDFTDRQDHQNINALLVAEMGGGS